MNPYQKCTVLVIRLCSAYTVASGFVMIGINVLDRFVPQPPAPIAVSVMPLFRNGTWVVFGLFCGYLPNHSGFFSARGSISNILILLSGKQKGDILLFKKTRMSPFCLSVTLSCSLPAAAITQLICPAPSPRRGGLGRGAGPVPA